ncbi:MAG: hypothetical protein ACYSU0_19050 [Planctomycetota bacterium]|jgi:hypothetical protein
MGKVYNGTGTASKDGTIRVDDPAGLPSGRVRVTVEDEVPRTEESYADVPPAPGVGKSAETILRELRALRDERDG